MLSAGGVTMAGLRDSAAIKIQSFIRGAAIRKTFKEHRVLMLKLVSDESIGSSAA
jgi:hypothetical protein